MSAPCVNLEAMCRLCMTEEEVVLFSLRAGQVPPRFEIPNSVVSKIRKLFNITMLQEGMPDKICHNCLIKVDLFYNFNNIVEAGQYKLMVLTRHVNKSSDRESPEGGKAVDNPVLPFSKFKKYALLRPLERAHAELSSSEAGAAAGRMTVTRSDAPDAVKSVKVRLKPYSAPQTQTDVPVATAAVPKIKSVSLKVHDLMQLKACPSGGTISVTPRSSPPHASNRFITRLFPDLTSRPSEDDAVPECPQPSANQACTTGSADDGAFEVKQEMCAAEERFECEVCSEAFYLRRPLLRHILTHYRDNIYTCHVPTRDCEAKVWFSSCEFRDHLVAEHRKQSDNHVVTALSQRAERNSRAEVCFICMASVKGADCLQQHMQAAHKGYFCCSVCRKWFVSARALHAHLATHEGGDLD